MFKEQMNKIKSMFSNKTDEQKEENGKKRNIENLVVFLILLIIVVIALNGILKEKDTKDEEQSNTYKFLASKSNENEEENEYEDELEKRLESILSTIAGVSNVHVLVTYSQSKEIAPMYNENNTTSHTTETDSNGGTRVTEEQGSNKEVIFTDESGGSVPATKTIINPKVEGVIVTAEGVDNASVKSYIVEAIVAVTGVGTHKVQVFSTN